MEDNHNVRPSRPRFSHRVNLPNYITLTRIAAIPLLIWILCTPRFFTEQNGEREILASTVFILASITDGIDGYLARKRGQITTMGMLLDPLADKLLVAAAFITLVQFNPALVPAWMATVVIGREFLVSGLRSIAASEGFTIQASELGKFKMLVQIISVVAVILARRWHEWPLFGIYIFPGLLDCVAGHMVHGSALAGFRARLLRRILVANRPQIREAATPVLRPCPAEKTRCPNCLKSRLKSRPKKSGLKICPRGNCRRGKFRRISARFCCAWGTRRLIRIWKGDRGPMRGRFRRSCWSREASLPRFMYQEV